MKRKNVQATLAVLAAVLAFVFFVPLPYRVLCTLEIKPRGAESIYVNVPGRLTTVNVKAGQLVAKDDELARLENSELEFEIARVEGEAAQLAEKEEMLIRLRNLDKSGEAKAEIDTVQKALAAAKDQLTNLREDYARLRLTTPIAGTILPPPDHQNEPDPSGNLPKWSGSPLDKRNLGAFLTERVLLCQVGDPTRLEAVAIVDQEEIPFIKKGQTVDLQIYQFPDRTYESEIAEIAVADLKVSPKRLTSKAGGELITETDPTGRERPQNKSYQALCPIDDPNNVLIAGMRGQAKIHAEWQTLAARTWRFLIRTFNFKL